VKSFDALDLPANPPTALPVVRTSAPLARQSSNAMPAPVDWPTKPPTCPPDPAETAPEAAQFS